MASPAQDMRSPDARDAAGGTQTGEPFAGAEPGAPAPADDADSWTTPAILGGGLALLVIAGVGVGALQPPPRNSAAEVKTTMRTHICTAIAATLLALCGTPALAATPPDAGNCWGAWVNGGDNGTSVSADAGPQYGRSFAGFVAGGAVGRLVSSADCHS